MPQFLKLVFLDISGSFMANRWSILNFLPLALLKKHVLATVSYNNWAVIASSRSDTHTVHRVSSNWVLVYFVSFDYLQK